MRVSTCPGPARLAEDIQGQRQLRRHHRASLSEALSARHRLDPRRPLGSHPPASPLSTLTNGIRRAASSASTAATTTTMSHGVARTHRPSAEPKTGSAAEAPAQAPEDMGHGMAEEEEDTRDSGAAEVATAGIKAAIESGEPNGSQLSYFPLLLLCGQVHFCFTPPSWKHTQFG